jgi:hypothetical protein
LIHRPNARRIASAKRRHCCGRDGSVFETKLLGGAKLTGRLFGVLVRNPGKTLIAINFH